MREIPPKYIERHGMSETINNHVDRVVVVTSARLHMGFFDLNGGLGRRFGSIGVSLDRPAMALHASRAEKFIAECANGQRAVNIAEKMAKMLKFQHGMHMWFDQVIPEHAGLGSGTQMSLAVGMAMSRLYDLGLSIKDVAMLAGRGARSGVGLGTFATGGVIVDGGRGSHTGIPPVIARADFPEDWRILLIFDHAESGVSGVHEIEAFRSLPEFSADSAAILCRHVLMQALPALAERDLSTFGLAIRELQERTGDYFAPIQGGRYASSRVALVLQWLGHQGVVCYGQSSWGPTGFAVIASEAEAEEMLQRLRTQFSDQASLEFMLCQGRNEGSLVQNVSS